MTTDAATMSRWAEENRTAWTDEHLVGFFTTWSHEWAGLVQHTTAPLVEQLQIAPGHRVLDLASGPGEPAITIARLVGPAGHVTATDISAGMLKSAAANAHAVGVTNLVTTVAPADDLPFLDGSFDRVTCRFGVMYFPDVHRALVEARRVLVADGRAGFTLWPPDAEHPYADHLALFERYFPSPDAEPEAPSSSRFSDGVSLGEELRAAGFEDIVIRTYQVLYPFPGNVEHFTRYAVDQFQPAIDALSEEQGKAFLTDLRELNARIVDDGRIEPTGPVIVVSGRAPWRSEVI
jgi:ubiquinone/menaquinone biosynthesis C-methylase UbiE